MRSTPLSGHLLVIVLLVGAAGLAASCGNVNVKAQRLAFSPAQKAADAFATR